MNEDRTNRIDPELEARVVGYVLGEGSPQDREELERLFAEQPELVAFKREMEAVHGLLGEAIASESDAGDETWRLSDDKRDAVLSVIGEQPPNEIRFPSKPADQQLSRLSRRFYSFSKIAALVCVIFTAGALALPSMRGCSSEPPFAVVLSSRTPDDLAYLGGEAAESSMDRRTLPSPYYLSDDVQYYPPSPEYVIKGDTKSALAELNKSLGAPVATLDASESGGELDHYVAEARGRASNLGRSFGVTLDKLKMKRGQAKAEDGGLAFPKLSEPSVDMRTPAIQFEEEGRQGIDFAAEDTKEATTDAYVLGDFASREPATGTKDLGITKQLDSAHEKAPTAPPAPAKPTSAASAFTAPLATKKRESTGAMFRSGPKSSTALGDQLVTLSQPAAPALNLPGGRMNKNAARNAHGLQGAIQDAASPVPEGEPALPNANGNESGPRGRTAVADESFTLGLPFAVAAPTTAETPPQSGSFKSSDEGQQQGEPGRQAEFGGRLASPSTGRMSGMGGRAYFGTDGRRQYSEELVEDESAPREGAEHQRTRDVNGRSAGFRVEPAPGAAVQRYLMEGMEEIKQRPAAAPPLASREAPVGGEEPTAPMDAPITMDDLLGVGDDQSLEREESVFASDGAQDGLERDAISNGDFGRPMSGEVAAKQTAREFTWESSTRSEELPRSPRRPDLQPKADRLELYNMDVAGVDVNSNGVTDRESLEAGGERAFKKELGELSAEESNLDLVISQTQRVEEDALKSQVKNSLQGLSDATRFDLDGDSAATWGYAGQSPATGSDSSQAWRRWHGVNNEKRGKETANQPASLKADLLKRELSMTTLSEATPVRKGRTATAGLDEKSASAEAFSTFSLHVSDVSFQLAKAALAQGKFPDAARVRIEEFVNAFDYGDPMPSQGEKVACQLEQAAHPFLQQRNLLRVSMRTAAEGRAGDTPLRLTLLLDNSGSMERIDRQETVHRAFALLAAQLKPTDQVTLISFARRASLLADKFSGDQSQELVKLVQELPSEGGTNIESALQLAFEKAKEQQVAGAQNRVILLTDGAVNLGDADPESLARMIVQMRNSGIAFDAAGICADGLNDEVLEALTRNGDGRYYLLDRPEDASDGFARQIAGALRPAAKNVKVQVEFNPKRVGRYKLLGFEKHRLKKEDFRNDKVDAAEMAAAEAGVALYQLEAKPDGQGDIGAVSVRFLDMATGEMVENRWPIPYEPNAPHIDQSAPSLRIATAAGMLAARLRGEPLGGLVDLKTLSGLVNSLPDDVRNAQRVQQLQQMLQQARQLSGN